MSNARNLSNFRPSASGQVETADIADAAVTAGKLDTGAAASNLGNYVSTVNGSTGAVTVQPTLVSGTTIKTVNSTSLLGSGDVAVQATLVSGTNIKTINSTSLLGSGDITVGASTDFNAVGTYIRGAMQSNGGSLGYGSTVSVGTGTFQLRGLADYQPVDSNNWGLQLSTSGLSGTWRFMGASISGGSNGWMWAAIFVRVS